MELKVFFLFFLCSPSQGWACGDKQSLEVCDCSGEKITGDDFFDISFNILCSNENITQGSGNQQCYSPDRFDDGSYNCVNRADEEYLILEDKKKFSSVVPCDNATDFYNVNVPGPGLKCGDNCWATFEWCRGSGTCGSFKEERETKI